MTPTITPSSAPLAVLVARGVVSVLVVDEPPTVECPTCYGEGWWWALSPCAGCDGSGRVPLLGRAQIATPDTAPTLGEQYGKWKTWLDPHGRWWLLENGMAGVSRPYDVSLGSVVATTTIEASVPIVSDYDDVTGVYEGPAALEVSSLLMLYPEWGGALDEHEITDLTDQRQFQEFPPGAWCLILTGTQAIGDSQ